MSEPPKFTCGYCGSYEDLMEILTTGLTLKPKGALLLNRKPICIKGLVTLNNFIQLQTHARLHIRFWTFTTHKLITGTFLPTAFLKLYEKAFCFYSALACTYEQATQMVIEHAKHLTVKISTNAENLKLIINSFLFVYLYWRNFSGQKCGSFGSPVAMQG